LFSLDTQWRVTERALEKYRGCLMLLYEVAVRGTVRTRGGGQITDNHYDATLSQLFHATRLPHNPSHQHHAARSESNVMSADALRRIEVASVACLANMHTPGLQVLLAHSLSRPSKLLRGLFSLSRNPLAEVVKARDGGVGCP